MIKTNVWVTQDIKVIIDETKFTEEFMEEFREVFYNFDTIEEHVMHLAQLYARGLVHSPNDFVEGYGYLKDMGISFELEYQEEEIKK